MLLGALLGLERELADKPAGLRTHMLVTGTASLLVGLSDVMIARFTIDIDNELIQADPIRIIEAVITGVSFLGAGTIFRRSKQGDVEGLTTAASILFAAAIGISVGLNQWLLAVGLVVLALAVLRGVHFAERVVRGNRHSEEND